MVQSTAGDDQESNEAGEASIGERLGAAWKQLDAALNQGDTHTLITAMGALETLIATAEPQTPNEYRRYFGALNTLAFQKIWEARVVGRPVAVSDVYETKRQLGLVLTPYPIEPSLSVKPPAYQGDAISTVALAVFMQNDEGILPLPDAPYRQGIDNFGLETRAGVYLPVSTIGPARGAFHVHLGRFFDQGRMQIYEPKWHAALNSLVLAERRLQLIEEVRQAIVARAHRRNVPQRITTVMSNSVTSMVGMANDTIARSSQRS